MVIIEWFRLWIRQQETRRKPPILKMFSQFCRSSSAFSFPFCCYAPTDRSDFVVAWVLFVCFYIYGWLPPFCIGFNKWAWLFTVTQHLTRRQIASTCALHFQIHFKFFWMGNLMISFKKKTAVCEYSSHFILPVLMWSVLFQCCYSWNSEYLCLQGDINEMNPWLLCVCEMVIRLCAWVCFEHAE